MAIDGRMLSGIGVLVAVVESGNFARAAETLSITPSGVSRAISRLENRLGVLLLQRTTRSVKLTEEGQQFYAQVMPMLTSMEDAADALSDSPHQVRGRLRVNIDSYFSRLILAPRLPEFFARYPQIKLELITREQWGGLVSDGMDIAVRFGIPQPSSLVARRLLETRVVTVASPDYLRQHGRPAAPEALSQHNCIQFRDPQTARAFDWEFHRGRHDQGLGAKGQQVLKIHTDGGLLINDAGVLHITCLAGVGIAQMFELGNEQQLASGELIDLFPDWPGEIYPLYAFYPSRRFTPAKVRVFIDFCLEIIGADIG
ncbi:LysR family transcriptional regulator [Providencia burhodogranariea]|uniref:LysR family transcriptional regulator n=1 Tax=Providencia burhodogranariea DSM 19968 TaxID=1141662 RepID=K8X0W6_9GAMM|nr:LysR family transcriptional regulator [Providencia burhodogranariea DSM 19968]